MKKLIVLLAYLYLLFPIILVSEDNPTMCPMDMSQFPKDTIPNYLQPWWNNVQIGLFAVVFVDFPDGRYINGNDTLQAFYDWQLEWVRDHGVLDAAGEMGIVLEPTNIQAGNKYVKASKYNWYDRWNMFFDSIGFYYGTAHPDNVSNGDTAYGSFKQYWKEASNGKFEVIPYVTHPNETNYKFKTGIVNDYQMINGIPVIKCIKMPKKKYGTDDANSYSADVGVPKSLLLIFELKQTFCANFLATNSITLPEKDISIFLFIQIFLIAFRESILI